MVLTPRNSQSGGQVLRECSSDVSAFIVCLLPEHKSPVGRFLLTGVAQYLVRRLAHSRCSLKA